jgi:hypothetical protein
VAKTRDFDEVLAEFSEALDARIEQTRGDGEGHILVQFRSELGQLSDFRRTQKQLER